jgi:hypothetical protein
MSSIAAAGSPTRIPFAPENVRYRIPNILRSPANLVSPAWHCCTCPKDADASSISAANHAGPVGTHSRAPGLMIKLGAILKGRNHRAGVRLYAAMENSASPTQMVGLGGDRGYDLGWLSQPSRILFSTICA